MISELKSNEEVGSFLQEGKELISDLLSKGPSDENRKGQQKEMLQKGQQLLKTVVASEGGKSLVKKSKTVCKLKNFILKIIINFQVEKAINTPEVRDMIMTSEKIFDEFKTNEKFRELLQSNAR